MYDNCEPSVLVVILLGHILFGNSFGCVDDAASENIQEIISMGSGLMWNFANVCGGRMYL